MKILYVNPSTLDSGLDVFVRNPPLNLITIAAMVPEHDAELFDFKVDDYQEDKFRNNLNRFDVVAITSLTPQIYSALDIAQIAKEQGCTTILGGYHPTLAPDFVAQHPAVDFAIRGEGEHTFRELIDYIDNNKNNVALKDIDGISYKNGNGKVVHNNDRALECNLDAFPKPRRDLLKGKNYFSTLGVRDSIETSRGCPHSCKFCCIIKMWKDPSQRISYRIKSTKRVIEEIHDMDEINKANDVMLNDDNFTIDVKRTKEILEAIIQEDFKNVRTFWCQSRVDTLWKNQWLPKLLARANFRTVFLGIESAHQQSLNAMNKKNVTPEMTRNVIKMLHDEGITIHGGVIIGYPGETKRMVRETILFAKSLEMMFVQFTPITAYPGTDFFNEMKEKGMITSEDYRDYDLFRSMMRTEELSSEEIYELVKEAYAAYYLQQDFVEMLLDRFVHNPPPQFEWAVPIVPQFFKTIMMSGGKMLSGQGVRLKNISKEFKEMQKAYLASQNKDKS
ncbi:MAG: B12-binding domain-containing radical SAM protein [Candidatus Helarchaeota archaeon]